MTYGAGARAEALTATDLDGDGDEDFALLNGASGTADNDLAVLLSLGDGTLEALPSVRLACPFVAAGACPSRGLAVGDFEQDGNVDLAVVTVDPRGSSSGDVVRVLRGRGDGSFASGPLVLVADEAMAISAGDYGGDGKIDLTISSVRDVSVQMLVNLSVLASRGNAEATVLDDEELIPPRYAR
jgi:hypothetical protein